MRLDELAREIGGRVLTHDDKARTAGIEKVYAGDSMNGMLNEASSTTLLVTNLTNAVLIRVAELTGVPGICLLNDSHPEQELLDAATEHGTVLIVSPLRMFETCGRLYGCLHVPEGVASGKATENPCMHPVGAS